ncbi:dihydrolipoamide dehydrogenase [Desulfotomaculum arcticum]|uniref:Dihydrolipoyl dehydrogenase n=1 Tax=Desulfotruncus arcticus DSM 17038 TaxID=1121424 RepID=A0A1I2UES2_9FIRM|nr:dihydrolipoyl dehydrogenase [Desulfotruncus arcticus]SFG73161.1 dihydrolipoamide dehydrogenase [Desulfotomaculum arcticum] [Desulfotruncus arcticus DSM 17038]
MTYKIAIIGGGPGGYVAAIRASQLGAKVAVVEKDRLGGTCLNRGCIPTKALVAATETLHNIKKGAEFGIQTGPPAVDFGAMQERKDQVVQRLVKGINFLFKKNKIDLFEGMGKLVTGNEIAVTKKDGSEEKITAENIIVATGSEPAMPSGLGYDGEKVLTSNEALTLREIPRRMLIIGGGVIGCEFAGIFAELGTEITIVELMPAILPGVEPEAAKQLQSYFKRRKIKVKTAARILEVKKNEQEVVAVLEGGEEIACDKLLISVGRSLNTRGLGLAAAGIALGPKGEIVVNSSMQTNIPHIYAIGDITNKVQLAHVASAQGITAVENIMGMNKEMNYDVIPSCIYTAPEIAGVGMTTQQAEAQGLAVKTGKFPFMALGKAAAAGATEGFVKILADAATDRVLGVHIIGPRATDLIAEAALAIKLGATVQQVTETIHAHPTFAEAMLEACEAVHGMSIHS